MFLRTILLLFFAAKLSAQQPRLVLPIGHTREILAACFSPDGKYVATASADNSIKLWEAQTGMLLNEYNGHKKGVDHIVFSADGTTIMSGDYDRVSKLWSVKNGTYISDTSYEWPPEKSNFSPEPFFNTDKTKKGVIKDSVITITDSNSGRYLAEVIMHGHKIIKAFFSPDEKMIFVSSMYGSYQAVFDVGSGKVVLDSAGNDRSVFSPDSKKILTIFNNECYITDISSGELLTVLRGYTLPPAYGLFTPDANRVVNISADSSIRMWMNETATLLPAVHGKTTIENGFSFSKDGKKMIIPQPDKLSLKMLDIDKGKFIQEITWKPKVSELPAEDDSLNGVQYEYSAAFLSPDEKRIGTASRGTAEPGPAAKIWDAQTGRLLKKYTMTDYTPSFYFSPDGKKILITAKAEPPMLCNAITGALIKILEQGRTMNNIHPGSGQNIAQAGLENAYISAAAFSPDGNKMVTAAINGSINAWSALDGKLLYHSDNPSYKGPGSNSSINEAVFSADGKRIATASWDSAVNLWDAETGRLIRNITDHHAVVNDVTFSPDGKELLSVADTGAAIISSATDGSFIAVLEKKYCNQSNPSYSRDGKKIITTSSDNSMNVWDAHTHQLQYSFFEVDTADYMYVLPSGYYKTTGSAARRLHYVTKDLDVMTFEQLDVKYNRPDKVLEATGSKNKALIESYRTAYYKRLQKLGIDSSSFSDGYSIPVADIINRDRISADQKNNQLNIHIKATDSIFKLDRFNVWINEVPLFGIKGINIRREEKNNLDTNVTVTLSNGDNRIETSVTNINGIESYRKPLLVKYADKKNEAGKVYFIGVGINHFADSTYDLKWCVQDIRDLTATMQLKYGNRLVIVDTLYNEKATRTNIRALKKKLMNTTVNDKVIISYSGHGLLSKDYDYYISSYTINFSNPEEGGIPYDEIENMLDSIPARKKILFLDACNSGEVDKEEMKKIQAASSGLSQNHTTMNASSRGVVVTNTDSTARIGLQNSFDLMQSLFVNVGKGTGAIIISASGGVQFAQERSELGHGVFTYSVIEAMKKYPTIKVSELKKYIGNRVLELTNGLQKPTTRNETIAVDWNVW